MPKKNELITVSIEDMSNEGLGIGHAQGMAVFVKDAVIGDTVLAKIVKEKKTCAFARTEEIVTPSPDRVSEKCPVARACGGCQLQMLSYPAQLQFKQNKVRSDLVRLGGLDEKGLPLEPVIGMEHPWRYRNKAQFPVGWKKADQEGRLRSAAGFYAGRTHSLIETEDCLLGIPENKQILKLVLSHMEKYKIAPYDEQTHTGVVRHVMTRFGAATGQIMTVLVLNGGKLPAEEELARALMQIPGMVSVMINVNREKTNVILGKQMRLLCGTKYLEDCIGPVRFRISPLSFYQVNPQMTRVLYEKVLEFAALTGTETVWDLYCGIGTISLFLSRHARRVFGVEVVPEAILDARENAALNGIENASFFVGRAEEVLPEKYEKENIRADVMVIDPPRKGCGPEVIATMIRMAPERIVYVSCDSGTLARDLRSFTAGGYSVKRVQAVDQFAMTVRVEVVVLLERKAENVSC